MKRKIKRKFNRFSRFCRFNRFNKKFNKKFDRFNILDGRKKTDRILRRILILLMAILTIVLFILLRMELKKEVRCIAAESEIGIENEYIVNRKGVVEQGIVEQGVVEAIEVESFVKNDKIKEYIVSYGGRINDEYLASLRKYCDEDTLKLVVAISVAETGMGKATDNYSNFYGYFYNGNRNYDPDYEEMSKVICNGISKYYSDVAMNRGKAVKYTGGDNVDMWIKNVDNALSKMQ